MKLYLLRHEHQEVNRGEKYQQGCPDPELSDLGNWQAELLGQRLSKYNISAVFTSDLKRAVQTAEIVNRHLGVALNQEPDLREIDMGEVSIRGWNKIAIDYPDFFREFQQHSCDIAYPNGESGFDVLKRAMPVLEGIIKTQPQDSNLAIICHGGVIMVLLTAILGMPQEYRFRFRIDHGSISIVEYDSIQRSFYIVSINDTAHLDHS